MEEKEKKELKRKINESSAFKSYESKFIIYDINIKGYYGLVYIDLPAPDLQQQVNRHGNVKIMVRIKCLGISKNR